MELYRPRSSSIPPHLRKIPLQERFTVGDAAQLKLHLQALDNRLEPDVDALTLEAAFEPRPFHEEVYVDGSEEFYLLVKGIPRPDLIPHIYIQALAAVQRGHFPLNQYVVSDFKKGVDPTFSEVRAVLPSVDQMCDTKLYKHYRVVEDKVKPFRFLDLPTELRLEVYSMLLPREEHIAIISQPLDHKPPKVSLDLLRVNQQLYQEVAEYFYANRTLYMLAARDKFSVMFSNEYISRYYEAIAAMGLQARQHFTKLEIQVGHLSEQVPVIRKHIHVPYSDSPMQNIMDLLPSLSFIVISVDHVSLFLSSSSLRLEQLCDTIEWLLSFIPDKIEVQWYFEKLTAVPPRTRGAREVLTAPITRRGPIVPGRSVLTRLRAEHDEKTRARQLAMLERLSNPSFQTVTSKPS